MQQYSFDSIFEALDLISKELDEGASGDRKKQLLDNLLSLRNYMDKCVQHWLDFEEKINELQQTHNFTLPDDLPQDFLNIIEKDNKVDNNYMVKDDISIVQTKNRKQKGNNKFKLSPFNNSPVELGQSQIINTFRRGLGFWELTMLEEAICEFEKVVQDEPDFVFGHFCLGLAYCQKKQYENSLVQLRLVKSLCKDKNIKALASNAIGNIYAEKKDYMQALEKSSLSLEIDPNFNMVWFNIGAILYNLKRYKQATQAFEKAHQYYPYDWEICYYLGKLYSINGDYNKAIYFLSKSRDINPSSSLVLFELGFVHDMLGNENLAKEYYSKIKK